MNEGIQIFNNAFKSSSLIKEELEADLSDVEAEIKKYRLH